MRHFSAEISTHGTRHGRFASLVLAIVVAAACTSSKTDSGSLDPKNSPYGPRTDTTKTITNLRFSPAGLFTSPAIQQETAVVGQKTINGKSFDRLVTKNTATPSDGGEYWMNDNGDSVDFAGGDLHSTIAAVLFPPSSVVFDTPIHADLNPPVGVPQAVTATGTVTPTGGGAASPVQATGTYTLAETNVVAQTEMGPLSGCSHFTGTGSSASVAIPAVLRGKPISAELWYHPSFGVVAFKAPDLGLESTVAGSNDCGAADASGFVTIRKVGLVKAGQNLELSSYGCSGAFDADKMTHAKMLLELRWLDETLAKSPTQPPVTVTFQTVLGIFPSMQVQSPVSVMHPEENGKGYVYWIGYVDQAAKNEPGSNGISYGISVKPGSATSAVRASARVHYKKI